VRFTSLLRVVKAAGARSDQKVTEKDLLKRMSNGTDLNAELRIEGEQRAIPPHWEEGLLRITQESLTNTIKHAQARNFRVTLHLAAEEVGLQLVDDGLGEVDPIL